MKSFVFVFLSCLLTSSARADFSFVTAQKDGAEITKHYLKGQKLMTDSDTSAVIIDFDAQSVTNIGRITKTYTVKPFSEVSQELKNTDVAASIDVKETGQHKTINGYDTKEAIMTISADAPQTNHAGMKVQFEMDMWLATDVPGAREMRAFYEKNAEHFPWTALSAGGNSSLKKSMVEVQKKLAGMGGAPVLQIMKMKVPGAPTMSPEKSAQMQQAMAQARARLEEAVKQGGAQGAAAQQALARMGGVSMSSSGGFEMTMESRDFSNAPIPDSVFAIPAGYQKTTGK